MTAATPRVWVGRNPWATGPRVWYANCPWCGLIAEHTYSWLGAIVTAETHLEDPCDGIRLAALLARLEGLRDFYRLPWRVPTEAIADDLDGIIREAGR